ncbi:hypothetical protein C4D60_Mb07t00860 [Musa balbisiana]|uniref:Bowman-Birk serine protease inhibitors family domain-containing protein n=1 Tax=Musa balbisiana TaxID=52838 RepID=A0A4S8JCG9_MUSBA|nr:hypothetical protein C4D60_Mb07t00860 [Musa balbisiana]
MGNLNVRLFLVLALLLSALPHKGASNTGTPSNETYVPVSPVAGLITVSQDELKLCSDCREGKPSGQCSYKPIACDCNNCK